LSMALNARGIPAVSFTGSQSGIITDSAHTNARIVEVRPHRVEAEIARGRVVIVAGYQGVSEEKEVTTLGRGGSDTTAVALAAALGAEACEIYSDVEGVYSADPRRVPGARALPEVSYEEMQELAEAGARVLNAQAVEFAKERGIAIKARSAHGGPGETVVKAHPPRGTARVVGVTSQRDLCLLELPGAQGTDVASLLALLETRGIPGRQVLVAPGARYASLVLPLENLHDFSALRAELSSRLGSRVQITEGVAAVSAIGAGITASLGTLRLALETLGERGILGVSTSSFRISVLLEASRVDDAVQRLHEALLEGPSVP
ncbi:MAG TPA: aspartate kinase, partial [Vicinamibacteria bacterium]|nr:aspartate kinase [Vicinamibacteria bacterium]